MESYNKSAVRVATDLKNDLDDLGDNLDGLESSLSRLKKALDNVDGISGSLDPIDVGGMTSAEEVMEAVEQAREAKNMYQGFLLKQGLTEEALPFRDFLVNYGGKSEGEADDIIRLLTAAAEPDFAQQLQLMEDANHSISDTNDIIREANDLISDITEPSAVVVNDLSDLCDTMGDSGLSGDLKSMSRLAENLLKDLKKYEGDTAVLTNHLDELGDLSVRVSQDADRTLDEIQSLNDTVNSYVPDTQQALADTRTLSDALVKNLRDTDQFLDSSKSLLHSSGTDLDAGTKQALSGMAEALRRSSSGLDETDTIRNAKDTITDLVDDEWDEHTGEENNILLMDAEAKPVSLTSPKNGTPTSIQYIMRSQEIKEDDESEEETSAQEATDSGTFWTRVKNMFRDFWNVIAGLFRHDG